MKVFSLLKKTSVVLLPIAMAAGVLLGTVKSNAKEVEGYSTSSLPTTIDLNDTSASNIRSYYSSLNNLSISERQGTNLLKNLKTILKNGQKYYSYDTDNNGRKIWQIYEIADRDWAKSPATSLTYGTYNSSTNTILNYQYGTGSDGKNNPYIHALYVNRNVTNNMRAWTIDGSTTSHGGNGEWCIDREHIWPKSHGFETEAEGGARGDPMHLWPGDSEVNSVPHNNYFYGYVNQSVSYTQGKWSYAKDNCYGKSLTSGGSTSVFEPQDCDKGDIARACFYMVARYNYLSGSDSNDIDSNNPNLMLTQNLSDYVNSGYDSSETKTGKLGILSDLLAWHHADPVDEFEIHRNNLLYTNYTNNRNPFVDFPEWVDYIWGTATYNDRIYQSYSSTPTGYANPSSDTINGYNESGTPSSETSISLNKNTLSLDIGGSETLTATVSPSSLSDKLVTWSSSNADVVSVNNGVIQAVSNGTATITATSNYDSTKSATCSVTINDHVTLDYNNSPFANTSSSSTAENNKVGGINYQSLYGMKYTTDSSIEFDKQTGAYLANTTPYGKSINRIVLNWKKYQNSSLLTVFEGSSSMPSTSTVTGSSNNLVTTYTFNENNSAYFKIQVISNTYYTNFSSIEIYFNDNSSATKTLESIAVKTPPTKTSYIEGEYFDPTGLVITKTYSDNSTEDVSYASNSSGFTFTPSTNIALTVSNVSVTIYLGGKSTTQAISVTASGSSGESTSVTLTAGTNSQACKVNGTNGIKVGTSSNAGSMTITVPANAVSLTFYAASWKGSDNVSLTFSGATISPNSITLSSDNGISNSSPFTLSGSEDDFVFTVNLSGITSETIISVASSGVRFVLWGASCLVKSSINFNLVTDVEDLRTGDEIVFVGIRNTTYYAATTLSNDYLRTETVSLTNNQVSAFDAAPFMVERNGNNLSFADSTIASGNNYLANNNNSGAKVIYQSSPTDRSRFNIAISNTGAITMQALSGNYAYFRFNYNSGNLWFCFSTSSTYYSSGDVYIYKKTTQVLADSWAETFLEDTENCSLTNWLSLASSYNNLSNAVKAEIVNVEANASTDYSMRAQAMARYDYMMSDARYSSASHFITGRGTSSAKPIIMLLSEENRKPIALIIICSLVSVSAIGGFFFIKGRKQEKI